jgi:hypothetical protein
MRAFGSGFELSKDDERKSEKKDKKDKDELVIIAAL